MLKTGRGNSLAQLLDEHRALLMLAAMFAFMGLFAPNFLSMYNLTTILKGASLNALAALGFTLIFIIGKLDLSIGAVVMLCGMLTIGLQPAIGWGGAIIAALLTGMGVGFVNGLLVVKARIESFIVTLGTMTVVTGLMHLYSAGGSKAIDDFRFGDWLGEPVVPLLPPIVIFTLVLVVAFTVFLKWTPVGRAFFMVGGNPETAWLAGLPRDRYQIAAFVICSGTAALAGIAFAASLSAMTSAAVLGTRTLMTVIAAVIIGGTVMTGGRGSVVKSYLAVLMLTTLFNGIGCFGLGFEVQIFVNGLILAVVVLYEAYILYRHNLLKGQRLDLLQEVDELRSDLSPLQYESEVEQQTDETHNLQPEEIEAEEINGMNSKDRFAVVCVSIVGIVAIVAIFVAYFVHTEKMSALSFKSSRPTAPALNEQSATEVRSVDVFALRGTDGQPLIHADTGNKDIPKRPANPDALPKTEKGHWWDIEYAGWHTEKVRMPVSPADGPRGKSVILLKAGDHPYWTAYVRGFERMADAYGMRTKIFNSNWNVDLQAQQTEQVINEQPDMVIFAPVDATACTPLLRRIYKAGIPCITSNTIPCDEAMKYCLAWTGPDDWGQMRQLARHFADALDRQGGYAIVRHMPGSSPFFARTYAPITELKDYAPDMKLLAMDTALLEAEGTMQLVSAWLTKFGDQLQGLILAGDGFSMTGTIEALENAGREDVVIVGAGNSKTGMDSVKAGDALAITYQSAEGDGAIAVHTAARWFKGEDIPPVNYLPKHIITAADVDEFMPAQW